MTHSILIIGQSNMAGRGFIEEAGPLDTNGQKLWVLRNGRWQLMYRPVNPDRDFSGTCMAESFAKAYSLDHPDVLVGVIPCADGGTCLDHWAVGSALFDNAVNNAKLAMRSSNLVAILWHQGESDCMEERYPVYREKLTVIMEALRRELGAEDVPLVIGGIGEFLTQAPDAEAMGFNNYPHINEALMTYAATTPHTVFVSAEGLTSNPDKLHFNHESLQEFGLRYYEAFKTIEDTDRVLEEKADDTKRTAVELL